MAKEIAVLAGGCFWCTEAIYLDVAGVETVVSGYIGGQTTDPTYREVCGGDTGHAEAVRIEFDNDVIAYGELLDIFFATHDPTQLNRQGGDVGTQYRSAIFPRDETQRAAAEAAIARANDERANDGRGGQVVTTIEPAQTWYPAEDYHRDYFAREGASNPYCSAVVAPKLDKFRKSFRAKLKNAGAAAS